MKLDDSSSQVKLSITGVIPVFDKKVSGVYMFYIPSIIKELRYSL